MWQVARKGTEPITLATLKIKKSKINMKKTQNMSMKSKKTLILKSEECHFNKNSYKICNIN